ncbi:hypothetical protein M8997_003885 [Phyllobacterium sp. 21LDTY02-6]|uniref:hypothetical protein n=1 Tax=Phyllobacterium sp. 21LDTY02-6 TaxID=2944903 RepID=UPI0020206B9E|nr:hypothetical protein [Phyllobacterium sp. 21LDTY02-6]MCO4316313.1 hypothetical protein [Phyllobacterium sp. 21LDTY02-6]
MNQRQVGDFVIVAPFEKRAAASAQKDMFTAYLKRCFPKLNFAIAPFAPVDSAGGFSVIPIMGAVGGDGECSLCEPPSRWLIAEIIKACERFDLPEVRLAS